MIQLGKQSQEATQQSWNLDPRCLHQGLQPWPYWGPDNALLRSLPVHCTAVSLTSTH